MSTNQFQEQWFGWAPGHAVDPDGVGGYQCVDAPKDYVQKIFANTTWQQAWPGAGNAKDMINTFSADYFTRTLNDPSNPNQIPSRGDVIIWGGNAANPYGHIAVVLSATASGVTVIEQDGGLQVPMFVGNLGYTNAYTGTCTGWLTPKFDNAPEPASAGGSLLPTQRKVGQYGVTERNAPSTTGAKVNTYDPGTTLNFKGYIHGQSTGGTDVWFVGAYAGNYFSASAFDDGSTTGLTDLTPKPTPAPALQSYQRVVSVATANYRDAPHTSGNIIQTFKQGDVLNFKAYVHGDSVAGTDIWFEGMYSTGYISASVFNDQSTTGLPEDKPAATTTPTASTTRTVGSSALNVRNSPFIIGSTVSQLAAGASVTVLGYTHGDSVNGNDVWYEIDKGWVWSGGVDSQATSGITAIPAPTRPVTPTYTGLNGIDISGAQKGIDLTKVDASFVIIKVSEGVDWSDPEFLNNLASARAAGKKVGFYHFARPLAQAGNTAQAESDSFLKFVTPHLQTGDVLALDWEAENTTDVAWAKEWLDRVFAATNTRPLFYADLAVLTASDWSSVSASYGLWLAEYPTSSQQGYGPLAMHDAVPGTWKIVMWQYSSKGQLANWTGDLDLDIFFGTDADWAALGYTVPAPTPTPAPAPQPTPAPTTTTDPAQTVTPAPSTGTPDKATTVSVLSSFFKWLTDLFVASR